MKTLLRGAAIVMAMGVVANAAYGQVSRGDRYSGASWATRSPVVAQHGMAANAALGLMEPVSNGIGGDLFAIVWDPKTKKLYGYNGSGRAAMGRDLAQMIEKVKAVDAKTGHPYTPHIPPLGSLPVTVPGTVDAWFALHEKFGKLPIGDDLEPAIGYAKN